MINADVAQQTEHLICNQEVAGLNPAVGTKLVLTAHQSMFLPWLGLISKIAAADQFVVFDAVPFERHGFGNRNRIKAATGIQWLTVPVRLKGHLDKPISQIEIVPGNWARKHLRAIELAYQRAPYFERYFAPLKAIYAHEWRYLAGLNRALLDWILDELGIVIPITSASEQCFEGSKSALVLDMCKKMGATEYIFGALGRDYADVAAFERAGVKVWFQDYKHPTYNQLHGPFVSNLSIIDLLFNAGLDSLKILKNG